MSKTIDVKGYVDVRFRVDNNSYSTSSSASVDDIVRIVIDHVLDNCRFSGEVVDHKLLIGKDNE